MDSVPTCGKDCEIAFQFQKAKFYGMVVVWLATESVIQIHGETKRKVIDWQVECRN